jgi:SAM-dependent methyltransferase
MESRNVYLYWVGKEYKLISILRNLIYLHSTTGKGYNVILITDKNIKDYIKNIPDYFSKLCPAHQADFVRVSVICDYGGIWLDSDTLVLNSLDSLFDHIENKNGFFIKQNNTVLCNGIFGSRANTPLMVEWKTEMIKILDEKQDKIEWSEVGCYLLQNLYNNNSSLYDNYNIFNGLDNLYPVNWDNCITEFIDKPYDNYQTIIREYQPLVVLVNSVYKKLEHKTENEILEGNMPINYFINKSFENKDINKNTIIFENIYKKCLWNDGDANIPLSGPGSSLENTKNFSNLLTKFIYDNECKSVLDLGCGDLTWIPKTQFFNDNYIKYTGIDVVESLIISHLKKFPEKKFLCKDITIYKDFDKVDIIIIRDVIFHLTNDEILSIFENIKNKFNFLVITSCKNNMNIDNFDKWHFSNKNIQIEPFNKSQKFIMKIEEPVFNRDVLIYKHDCFYDFSVI